MVQRAVSRDSVEPWADVDRTVIGEHRVVRRGEDLLQYVLGVLARGEQVPAEGEQPGLVARAEHLERCGLATAGERGQAVARMRPPQGGRPPPAPPGPPNWVGGGLHG